MVQQFPVIELERLRAYRQEPGEKDGQTVAPTAGAQEREHRCAGPESYAGEGGGKSDSILSRAEGLAVVVTNGF